MKKFLIGILAAFCLSSQVRAQVARDNHIFFHVDFAAGNVYTAAFPSFVTWGLNELTQSNIFESAMEVPFYSADGFDLKQYSFVGYTAHDLFKDIHPSLKIGYQSRRMSEVNWGLYATAEFAMNQFQTKATGMTDYEDNNLKRALFGGSLFFVFGGIDKSYHFMLEAGCRYSMALDYKGPLGLGKDDINNGIVSHVAFKVTGASAIQDFGVYADFNHFDFLKHSDNKLKMFNVGLVWTVTPGQRENRNNIY